MKTTLIIVASFLGFIVLAMGGCAALNRHIYSQTDCEKFNIDNIEVRTGINIPSVKKDDCHCEEGNKSKKAKFMIDTDQVDLTKYIADNKFEKKNNHYINNGERDDTKWSAQLNNETGELIVEIDYLK